MEKAFGTGTGEAFKSMNGRRKRAVSFDSLFRSKRGMTDTIKKNLAHYSTYVEFALNMVEDGFHKMMEEVRSCLHKKAEDDGGSEGGDGGEGGDKGGKQ